MEKLLKYTSSGVPGASKKRDDDFADRLSAKFTVLVLIVCALINTIATSISKPIICWGPAHFNKFHMKYANSYCWIRNTYYQPWEDEVPRGHDETPRQIITYYQWIPMILMIQVNPICLCLTSLITLLYWGE